MLVKKLLAVISLILLSACGQHPWNNPHPKGQSKENILFTSFNIQPKTLDPAKSYSHDEIIFISQVCEPPLQYHFLKRPYTLVPLTATSLPKVSFFDQEGKRLPQNSPSQTIAYSIYEIEIKPGIFYQRHPAFAKNSKGQYWYHNLKLNDLRGISQLSDFKHQDTRELVADDYVYQIKRIGQPGVNSPIFGIMATRIVGLREFANELSKVAANHSDFVDLRKYPLAGAQAVDRYHYRIILKGPYPQFMFWLSLHFFVPIPWEADLFYSQPGMAQRNITFDWYPVGTGPYVLIENNPNRQMVLQKNPLFRRELFPQEGEPGDLAAGFLQNAGKPLPFIDKVVFSLEKETIPRWNKFLQGYYDQSTLASDSFDQAIQIDQAGNPYLTTYMKRLKVYLQTVVTPTLSYIGFNMLDKVVGGPSARARKLRLAISIAVDFNEYIAIFLNGRGMAAQGPIPPGIFGFINGPEGINHFVYNWSSQGPILKPIEVAKKLMVEAGYAEGIDPRTGEPLILNYDVATSSSSEDKAFLGWIRQQFAKIGIALNIRSMEYNRSQEMLRLGQSQIYMLAWAMDYPDPENCLFLLYGPNGKVLNGGENASNYQNSQFDKFFDQMKDLPNNEKRQQVINKMLEIVRHDAPWVWGVNPKEFVLSHSWVQPSKLNVITSNILKYQRLDPILRARLQRVWNKKVLWPIALFAFCLILISVPIFIRYGQKERQTIKKSTN